MPKTPNGRACLRGQSIGAHVIVTTGDVRQMREIQAGLGHCSHQDDTDCRFGVGQSRVADLVEIHWPDPARTVQRFASVPMNRFYRLKAGGELEPAAH